MIKTDIIKKVGKFGWLIGVLIIGVLMCVGRGIQKDFPKQGHTTLRIGVLTPEHPGNIQHIDVAIWDPNLGKWIALSTTGTFVGEIINGIYGHHNEFTTTWNVDKFLKDTNYDYSSLKGEFLRSLVDGLHILHDQSPQGKVTIDEQSLREIADDMVKNGYNNLARECAILAASLWESSQVQCIGLYAVIKRKGNTFSFYFVDKNTFYEMRNNGTGNEPF